LAVIPTLTRHRWWRRAWQKLRIAKPDSVHISIDDMALSSVFWVRLLNDMVDGITIAQTEK
jgi:hypothetical protein